MPEIPKDTIEKIKRRDIQNIVKLAASGKPLSRAQIERIESAVEVRRYAANKSELAETYGVTRQALHDMCRAGLILPHKGRQGYSLEQFKKNYEDFEERRGGKKSASGREEKLSLECEKLRVNIDIDKETRTQRTLETKRILGEMIPMSDHRQTMDDIRTLYLDGLNQIVENVATKLRSVKARDVLQAAVDGLRNRIAKSADA